MIIVNVVSQKVLMAETRDYEASSGQGEKHHQEVKATDQVQLLHAM